MADLRDLLSAAQAFCRKNDRASGRAKPSDKKNAAYRRIACSGSERLNLLLRRGAVADFRRASDMRFDVAAGEKKANVWRVGAESFGDADALIGAISDSPADLPNCSGSAGQNKKGRRDFFDALVSSAQNSEDPRFPFDESLAEANSLCDWQNCDPAVAEMLSPLFFSRAFDVLRPLLSQNILCDAQIQWRCGGWLYDGSPAMFGYIDDKIDFFAPQTQASFAATFFHAQTPHLRRHIAVSSHSQDDARCAALGQTLSAVARSIAQVGGYDALAFGNDNADCYILMPSAVYSLVYAIIEEIERIKFENAEPLDPSFLSSELVLRCDPGDRAFAPNAPGIRIDARARRVRPLTCIQNGAYAEFPQTDIAAQSVHASPNGHAAVSDGSKARFFCPVLAPLPDAPELLRSDVPAAAEIASQTIPGRLCCIERAAVIRSDLGDLRIIFPNGGIICKDGECLGHAAAPRRAFPLSCWLKNARAVCPPARIGGIAVPALSVTPDF